MDIIREQHCFTVCFRPKFSRLHRMGSARLDSEQTKRCAGIPSTTGVRNTGVDALIGVVASSRLEHTTINSMAVLSDYLRGDDIRKRLFSHHRFEGSAYGTMITPAVDPGGSRK